MKGTGKRPPRKPRPGRWTQGLPEAEPALTTPEGRECRPRAELTRCFTGASRNLGSKEQGRRFYPSSNCKCACVYVCARVYEHMFAELSAQ